MKKLTVVSPAVLLALSIFITCVNPASAASVLSMLKRGTDLNEAGETINLVEIKCSSSSSAPRLIQNIAGGKEWCSQDIPTNCTNSKIGMANKVCRFGFTADIEEYQNSLSQDLSKVNADSQEQGDIAAEQASDSVTESQAEEIALEDADSQEMLNKVALEKERIKIEQQRLQIRRQELELNKRQLELEQQSSIVSE